MPTTVQIVNRYVTSDNVAGAAVVFDAAAIDAHSPRTRANGQVVVATEALADGNHVMHIVPDPNGAAPVGPAVAEGLGDAVKRMFRSLDVNVAVRKGKITTLGVPLAQARNGTVWAATNPVRVELQPIYHRSPFQNPPQPHGGRPHADHRASDGRLRQHRRDARMVQQPRQPDEHHYVVSAEAASQAVKVVQDTGRSWHAGHDTFWLGKTGVNHFSIGIELSHKTGTPFPDAQIDALLALLDRLRAAYPSIPANGVVGHMDVLTDASLILAGRDCPGFDFDWVLLERRGLGLIPSGAAANLDMYGGFFRLAAAPNNSFVAGDSDGSRTWGGVKWPAPAPAAAPGGAARQARAADRDRRADRRASDGPAQHRLFRGGGRPLQHADNPGRPDVPAALLRRLAAESHQRQRSEEGEPGHGRVHQASAMSRGLGRLGHVV